MVRARENVGQRAERSLVLENFRGVDFTSSPLRVDPRRAVKCRNLLPYGGRNVKRRGWRQEAEFREYDSRAGKYVFQPVRGMWWYTWKGDSGEASFRLVHAGNKLYISRDGADFTVLREAGMGGHPTEAFSFGQRLYLVGNAAYLVFGTWDGGKKFELREVADDVDTYVPRTSMAINPTTDEDGEAIEDSRRTLDAVNLLSSKRINTCMGRKHGGHTIILRLDGGIEAEDVECTVIEVELGTKDKGVYTETWKAVITGQTPGGEAWLYNEADIPDTGEPNAARKGELYYSKNRAELWINVDCSPPIEGRDNVSVTFKAAGTDMGMNRLRIGLCRFGILFGGGGNADRLFLSGNPSFPSLEFYSGWRDPTYFPDTGCNALGSEASAVVGFSRISDGVLAVFKEEGRGEPVIYYQTAEDVPIFEKEDDEAPVAMRFKLYTDAGNAGESIISRAASVDFYGDPLILSGNGVFGLSYKTNVETADRYAAERSRNIRADLMGRDLSKACGAVWENKYWLAVGGVCYVADAGYTCKPAESTSGFQYEWWYLDGIPASVMCVAEGRLYFGTEDGRLCYFHHESEAEAGTDAFRDLRWGEWTSSTVEAEDLSRVVLSDADFQAIRIGDRMTVNSPTHALWLDVADYTVREGRIELSDADRILTVAEGLEVYADNVGDSGLSVIKATGAPGYTVREVNVDDGSFCLYDSQGEAVALSCGGFRLGTLLTGQELHVIELIPDESDRIGGAVRVSLCEGGEPLIVMDYDGRAVAPSGRITQVDAVAAEWYTPVLDLGTNMQTKTLTRLTAAAEPGHSGRIAFGYETRAVSKLATQALGMGGLDLTNLDFNEFSLSAFAASWTVRLNERNINYIAFRWLSEEPSDCRVDSITARYKITGNIRGGL